MMKIYQIHFGKKSLGSIQLLILHDLVRYSVG